MQKDESAKAVKTQINSMPRSITGFFVVALTIIYAFAEAIFIHDLHILKIHNALPDASLSAFVFQLSLAVSFLIYLLIVWKGRALRPGPPALGLSVMLTSLVIMMLLQCVSMEREIAVAVYKAKLGCAP